MALSLRCNNHQSGYCRKELQQEAFITICSHIFCKDCVQKYGFQNPSPKRQCLACGITLAAIDDVVPQNLRPTEKQQGHILSGCDPNTIMESAAKAMGFWNYQMSTEIAWQEHLVKEMTNKYQGLYTNARKVVDDANTEIGDLQERIESLMLEKKGVESRIEEVVARYKEKSQSHQTLLKLYETLKNKVQAEQTREAAAISAEHTLQSMASISRPDSYVQQQSGYRRSRDPAEMSIGTQTPFDTRHHIDQPKVERLHLHQRSGGIPRTQTSSSLRPSVTERVPLRAPTEYLHNRMNTAGTPARVTLTRSTGSRTFSPSIDRHTMSKQFAAESLDRRGFESQDKSRHENNMQGQHARERIAMTPNIHSRITANRGLY